MPYRILVTGSRHWNDVTAVRRAFDDAFSSVAHLFGSTPDITLVHGGAGGADFIACDVALREMGWSIEAHPADWRKHGKAAGPIRNEEMVDAGAHICLAFPVPGSRGTWDCIRKAADAGIPVRIYPARGQ